MSSIQIKNIGPIANTGILELNQYNIFIGKQSTGKSTVMKILCFCKWIEKRIMTGSDEVLSKYTHYNRFRKELMQFHRLNEGFFSPNSEIHYKGDCIAISLMGTTNAKITKYKNFDKDRYNTKLCFIPSERNLVSAIKNVDRAYKSNDLDILFNHIFEWSEAKEHYTESHPVSMPFVDNMEYFYDKSKDADIIRLRDRRKEISPFYASSGVQSALPIVVMVDYYTKQILDKTIDLSKKAVYDILEKLFKNESKDADLIQNVSKVLSSKEYKQISQLYTYQSCQLFIEEPEQNLFPESQQALIENIVKSIHTATQITKYDSSVTFTTHSPYVITALNVLLKAHIAMQKNREETLVITAEDTILPLEKVRAYYISENGSVKSVINQELNMISGLELDSASDCIEDKLSRLDDIIYA